MKLETKWEKATTPNVAEVSYALRHGRINKFEAASLDPANWNHLLDDFRSRTIGEINLNTMQFKKS